MTAQLTDRAQAVIADSDEYTAPIFRAPSVPASVVQAEQPELCYSLDEEYFNYTDIEDVLQALGDQDALVEGATFYEGEAHRKAPSYYFDVDSLIESMGERAYDDAGEWADTFPDLPKAKVAELESIVKNWLDANVTHTFYTVLNTRKVTVTAEMLPAAIAATAATGDAS